MDAGTLKTIVKRYNSHLLPGEELMTLTEMSEIMGVEVEPVGFREKPALTRRQLRSWQRKNYKASRRRRYERAAERRMLGKEVKTWIVGLQ